MSVIVGPQIIGAEPFDNAAPSGQKLIMKYATGFPGKWYYEVVPCRNAPKRCCQHGTSDTATLTVSGTFAIDPTNQYNLVWNGSATGTFILDTSDKILDFDCNGIARSGGGQCGWSISMGGVATGHNTYWDEQGNPQTQGLNFRLVYKAGVGLNNDYTSYVGLVVLEMWACGITNPPVGGAIVGPPQYNQVLEAAFGYTYISPDSVPTDPLNCNPLLPMSNHPGIGAAGLNVTLTTP